MPHGVGETTKGMVKMPILRGQTIGICILVQHNVCLPMRKERRAESSDVVFRPECCVRQEDGVRKSRFCRNEPNARRRAHRQVLMMDQERG